jgi:hypothetical protein
MLSSFQVVHKDVGATIRTTIYLDNTALISYFPGTRYENTAQAVYEEVMITALTPLLEAAATLRDCHGIKTGRAAADYDGDF